MSDEIYLTPAEISHNVHLAVTEAREVMEAVTEIVKNVNSSINENMATIAAKYNITERHIRTLAQVNLLKFDNTSTTS